ncbi:MULTISPECIES: S1C family serine protease [Pseudonocardia]|uniref:Periplasmic serine endoprotease DegP n=2 Tax=Pseudonocardia TaxID=1847 RepID=A0A1Y2MNG5_PSEAH|nr:MULTISPECIES: trypsin-like peptidase domain-containing protein [Pseudonocardia]OSY36519.1 Periplasmic serine endoprotease DegP precursor [Pseudonocardia autotrophica]TDN76301.1 putative serine protease PepD [Pseudonocardia autotrophica]BBG00284.1 peptidase S1 [Pseudonocardia autotrophica]GEC29100.1 peptidase S1 [Pseudonocardia saturnea]
MTENGPGPSGIPDGHTPTAAGGSAGGDPAPSRPERRSGDARTGHADDTRAEEAPEMSDTEQRRPSPEWAAAPGTQPGVPAHGAGSPPTSVYPPFPPQNAPRPPKPPKRFGASVIALALAAGLVGGGVGFGGAYAVLGSSGSGQASLASAADPGTPARAADGSIAGAAAAIMPSTVDIQVRTGQGVAEGSGVVLTADGEVLTNNHVVSGAAQGGEITVTLSDGTRHQATVVGTSPSYDLAVIRLQGASGLTAATLGESSGVQVGEQVVATGSPQGLSGTVTAGIVSALNRTVAAGGDGQAPVVYNGLQTDAPINQGNSGGPLVNLAGQVVGINSAIATTGQSQGSIGLGFAIPVDTAKRVAQELMSDGVATKPQLGVQGSVNASRGAATGGAEIAAVQPGSPAAQAGLREGDVVTEVDQYPVSSFADLIARVGNFAPGQQVTLTVGSGADARQVPVTLGSVEDTAAANAENGSSNTPNDPGQLPFGFNPFGDGN